MPEFENIKISTEKNVALLSINRPEALNSLNLQTLDELGTGLDTLAINEIEGCVARYTYLTHRNVSSEGSIHDSFTLPFMSITIPVILPFVILIVIKLNKLKKKKKSIRQVKEFHLEMKERKL